MRPVATSISPKARKGVDSAIAGGWWRSSPSLAAMRDVDAGEELTTDDALFDMNDDSMTCGCGTASCRGTVTGRDWERRDLQERYRGWFSAYLQARM